MKGRRGEHGAKAPAGKLRVLESRVHERDLAGAFQISRGERKQLRSRLHGDHLEGGREKIARQLPTAAPDLEHEVSGFQPRDGARLLDKLLRVSGPAAVVLDRHLIEDASVLTWRDCCHARKVDEAPDRDLPVAGAG
jgi:hypothetical protein